MESVVRAPSTHLRDKLSHYHAHTQASIAQAEANFADDNPDYDNTRDIDEWRCREYARLDNLGHIYLDYTGGGLYGTGQIEKHTALLTQNIYGNPHSLNPTSYAATEITEQARHYVLQYFNADPEDYTVIFTMNASNALKLVGEAYPFDSNSHYVLVFDNHNSVNGIREYARSKGSHFTYCPLTPKTLRIDEAALMEALSQANPAGNNLFAFPAQSNFSGVKHPLSYIETAQSMGWDVLLDAAAFAPTNPLDLSAHKPQFVSLSFYKMFGYPTGIGALIIRRDAMRKLRRPWFAGGTITVATVQGDRHYLHENEAAFEDGTINYLGIPAVEIGLRQMEAIGLETIHQRVALLTKYILNEIAHMRHTNGAPLVHIYGPTSTEARGGTIAFNLYDPQGNVFDYHVVEALANEVKLSLRTGCFCNPGAGESAHGLTKTQMQACFHDRQNFTELAELMIQNGMTDVVGAIRASLGIVSNFSDAYHLITFLKLFKDEAAQ